MFLPAIAWAVLEDITERIGCRVLFATHFHELSAIAAKRMPGVRCLSMGVVDTDMGPVLTHKVVEGAMSKSFGISVAQRAGLPAQVIQRASSIAAGLDEVEASEMWLRAVSKVEPRR